MCEGLVGQVALGQIPFSLEAGDMKVGKTQSRYFCTGVRHRT